MKWAMLNFEWVTRGFGSMAWMRFDQGFAAPGKERWREDAERFGAEARTRAVRISTIGAFYRNPLDPAQTEFARARKIWMDPVEDVTVTGHLMGTCRMGADPRKSVVNPDHRVSRSVMVLNTSLASFSRPMPTSCCSAGSGCCGGKPSDRYT